MMSRVAHIGSFGSAAPWQLVKLCLNLPAALPTVRLHGEQHHRGRDEVRFAGLY